MIFASVNGISGFVYWRKSIGGVHCCQYGPSPREKLIVPFHPVELVVEERLDDVVGLVALGGVDRVGEQHDLRVGVEPAVHGLLLELLTYFFRNASPRGVSFMVGW